MGSGRLSAHQLAEFLAVVTSFRDERSATLGAVERAAEALEAEVGAVVRGGSVESVVGFPEGAEPVERLVAIADGRSDTIDVPGLGTCQAVSVPLTGRPPGRLLLARLAGGFDIEEANLIRGMARVLSLSLEVLRALEAERTLREESDRQAGEKADLAATLEQRQVLLEKLLDIQRAISHRAPLQEVLDTITQSAMELMGDDEAALRLIDPDDPEWHLTVSTTGIGEELVRSTRRQRLGEGASGRVIAEGQLVVMEDYGSAEGAIPLFAESGVRAAIGAPVHENGQLVGSLVVASHVPGRTYGPAEQRMLLSFAEHASIALTDAKTVERMHQAFHDSLTGLPNRALFLNRLEEALARANRDGTKVAVLFADLDRFKMVNDSLGHGAGDELLILAAERIRRSLRTDDMAARLGGDEFSILVEAKASMEDVTPLAARMIDSLKAPFQVGGREMFVSASIGIATNAGGREEPGELLRNADVAMYRAKMQGRGRFAVFEPGMHVAVMERIELEADLRRAVKHREFVIRYEPIVRIDSGAAVGVEALVRWRHPSRGELLPDAFIPVAEETGMIVAIGHEVLREACRQAKAWQGRFPSPQPLFVSVNLSAREFQQPTLVADVAKALADAELEPGSLVLEITESALMQDLDGTIAKLEELKRQGVRIAIDDFGTGYSSLSYLRQLPVDILKIDKSFVDGVSGSIEESALTRAIVKMGEELNLQTVAEGVEEEGQVLRLRAMRCRYAQGYFFSRPTDVEGMDALLQISMEGYPERAAG